MEKKIHFHPEYNYNYIDYFTKLETSTFRKKSEFVNDVINSINEMCANLLVKMIKFYYSDIHNRSSHMHVAVDSIVSFIFNRISNFEHEKMIEYCSNHKFITPELLKHHKTFNFFKIKMSENMLNKYNHNLQSNVTIHENFTDYYSIECSSRHSIEYLCSNYKIVDKNTFKNYKGQNINIPFSVLRDPQLYVSTCNCYINKLTIKMYIIRLENQSNLLIINWPITNIYENNDGRHPFNIIYNFLIINGYNFANIINNSVRENNIKTLALPLLDNIYSNFQRMHVPLEDMPDFEKLFVDNQNSEKKCDNFNFSNFSKLSNNNKKSSSNIDTNIKGNINSNSNYLIINNPFLYLIFNKRKLLLSGGIFDCDDVISSHSYFTPGEKSIKFFSF